ncbi:hypothetical protein [Mesorhizobium sp. WSM3626]|nr:hypothetical protein [Mesorhizobium sp. WSM3626]
MGKAALELDWSEVPCLFRALWRFGLLIAAFMVAAAGTSLTSKPPVPSPE